MSTGKELLIVSIYLFLVVWNTSIYIKFAIGHLGPVARSLVNANRWLRGIKMYRFPWYLTLVSTNHASSNPGLFARSKFPAKFLLIPFQTCTE